MLRYFNQDSQSMMLFRLTSRPEKIWTHIRLKRKEQVYSAVKTLVLQYALAIMKMKLMVMKMLATATTDWSAEMAMAMAAAVQATRITVSMKMKNADTVGFSPAKQRHFQHVKTI